MVKRKYFYASSQISDAMNITIDQKVRYGMFAVVAASVLLASLGLHIGPLADNQVGGAFEL